MATAEVGGEVLVVDNASMDGSGDLAVAEGARVVHEPLKEYGYAYLRGFQKARGNYIIIGDASGTYDFSLEPQFLAKLKAGDAFANGSRIKGQILKGAMPISIAISTFPF